MTTLKAKLFIGDDGNLYSLKQLYRDMGDKYMENMTDGMFDVQQIQSAQLAAGLLTNATRCDVQIGLITGLPLTGGKLTAGTYPIGNVVPGGSLVTGCVAVATTGFDGNAAITIGRTSAQTSLIPSPTLTVGAVTGDDPSTCGTDLWVAGSQSTTAGNWTATFPTITTSDDWTVTDFTGHTQTKTPTAIGAGSQTKTAANFAVSTYAHPKNHWCANDTQYNAYLTNTTGTVGELDVYIFYVRGVMSG